MAGRINIKIVCLLLVSTFTAGICAGCSKENTQSSGTSVTGAGVDDSSEEQGYSLPEHGTVAGVEYTVYNEGHNNGKEKRGYFINSSGQPDAPYYIIINSGERPSGGYEIRIADIYEDSKGQFVIKVTETSPAPGSSVTANLTYPCCSLMVNKVPDRLIVVDANGNEINRDDDKQVEVTADGGYIAVLEDGSGEIIKKTYVYRTDAGYRFVNVTATTVRWGSPEWKEVTNGSGEVSSKDEIVSVAKDHGSYGFVLFAGDNNAYSVEEFLNREI